MVVKKFEDYITTELLCEDMNFKEIPMKNRDMSGIFDGFKSMKDKFTYIGKFYWSTRNHKCVIDDVAKTSLNIIFKDTYHPIEQNIFGEIRHDIESPEFDRDEIYFSPGRYFKTNNDDVRNDIIKKYGEPMGNNIIKKRERVLNEYMSQVGTEKVFRFIDGGDLWFCLYNMKDKYYYFMKIDKRWSTWKLEELFTLWIRVKTGTGFEKFSKEYEKRCVERKQDEDEWEKKNKLKKLQEKIKDDYKKNPHNYKEISYYDLPKDIQKQLEQKGEYSNIDNCEYVEVSGKTWSYYDNEGRGARVKASEIYVNNRDLTDGYVYTSTYKSNWTGD